MTQASGLRARQGGFTLVEMVITMTVFLIIMGVATKSFNNIIALSSKFTKSEESNISGIVGLELMRHDLEQMGFGLFWGFCQPNAGSGDCSPGSSAVYAEAVDAGAAALNDAPSGVPRALVAADSTGAFASDLLAVKGTTLGRATVSQRWSYIPFHNFSAATGLQSRPALSASNNLQAGDYLISVRSNFNNAADDHLLSVDPADNTKFYTSYLSSGLPAAYQPYSDQQTHMIYGVATSVPRMPFNRADFFIKVPDGSASLGSLPSYCAPDTGELYKAVVDQGDGSYGYIPLLDCVADLQVELGWSSSSAGSDTSLDTYSSAPGSDGNPTAVSGPASASDIKSWLSHPDQLRGHLKLVKVYLLVQDGKRDTNYSATSPVVVGDLASLTHSYNLSPAQKQYRWKVYQLVIRPKNLQSNQ